MEMSVLDTPTIPYLISCRKVVFFGIFLQGYLGALRGKQLGIGDDKRGGQKVAELIALGDEGREEVSQIIVDRDEEGQEQIVVVHLQPFYFTGCFTDTV